MKQFHDVPPAAPESHNTGNHTFQVTPAEFDIILAGLRALALIQRHSGIRPDSMLGGIITNMGKNPIPDTGTIDALGDRLNCGD